MTTTLNTVLITGASRGIGLDIARGFLEQGANVVLNARDGRKLTAAAGALGHADRIALVPGDIGDKETGRRMVDAAADRFGRVDVLVNNAGIFGLKPYLDNSEEDLERMIGINLKGTYFVTQAAVRQMNMCPARPDAEVSAVMNRRMVRAEQSAPGASIPLLEPAKRRSGLARIRDRCGSRAAAGLWRSGAAPTGRCSHVDQPVIKS